MVRSKRDLMEESDNILWSSMILDQPSDPARARYQATMRRVEALGLTDRPRYGSGGSLEWRHEELQKIVLPFNSTIV